MDATQVGVAHARSMNFDESFICLEWMQIQPFEGERLTWPTENKGGGRRYWLDHGTHLDMRLSVETSIEADSINIYNVAGKFSEPS